MIDWVVSMILTFPLLSRARQEGIFHYDERLRD
jgi:hypothetical protein